MFNTQILTKYSQAMQQQAPLVHCMTNDVVNNFTANVLLAIGAAPAMVVAQEESADFARLASALLINVGTLTPELALSMRLAIQSARAQGVPWVLDPVAYGVLAYRSEFCDGLLALRPTVIRGNAAEIAGLSGLAGKIKSKGVESLLGSDEAIEYAVALAKRCGSVVAMTGETDYVTDGEEVWALRNGHALLTRVTGTGCALGAMVAGYCAVCETPVQASLCALSHMAIAGEVAAKNVTGVGSFAVGLLDALQLFASDERYAELLKVQHGGCEGEGGVRWC
ncbi:MAG: hydroxyethylthiazole kinase [Saezia sp.]